MKSNPTYFKHYSSMQLLLGELQKKQDQLNNDQNDFIKHFTKKSNNAISYDTYADLATKLSSQGVLSRQNTELSNIIKMQKNNNYLIFTKDVVMFLKKYLNGLYDGYKLYDQARKISQIITIAKANELFLCFLTEALICEINSKVPISNNDFNQFRIKQDEKLSKLSETVLTSKEELNDKITSLETKIDEKFSSINKRFTSIETTLKDLQDFIKKREAEISKKLEEHENLIVSTQRYLGKVAKFAIDNLQMLKAQ